LSHVYTRWLPFTVAAAVVVYYFWYLLQYALNIPYQDEVYDVLGFMAELVDAEDWRTALQLFFIKWNEHSTASARLVYYLSYRLFGEINFVALAVMANTALVVFVGLLYLRLQGQAYRWLILLPVIFTLFNFRAYFTALWSMTAFAYFYVLVYGFCSLYCLHQLTPRRFVLALVFATLATFSLASGQLVWLAGLLGIAHQVVVGKRISWWYLPAWTVAAVAALLLWHSSAIGHPDVHFEYLSHQTPGEVEAYAAKLASATQKPLLATLLIQLKFFLAMLGGVATDTSVTVAIATGALFLLAFSGFAWTARRAADIRLELCCVYILLTIAAMTYGRAQVAVLEGALNSRFTVPSAMLVCILWVLLVARLQLRNVPALYLVAALAGANNILAYATYWDTVIYHHDTQLKFYNKQAFWLVGVPVEETTRVANRAIELGVYSGPARPVPLADPTGTRKPIKKPSVW